MGISENDNAQDKIISEHSARLDMVEKNMSTLSQAVSDLTVTSVRQTAQVEGLVEATRNNLQAVAAHGESIVALTSNQKWMRGIGYTIIAAIAFVVGAYFKSTVGL